MATYYTDTAARAMRSGVGVQVVPFRFAATTTVTPAFGANGDILVLCKLPPYSTLVGFQIDMPDFDSGNTSRAAIGTLSNATRFTASYNTADAAARVSSFDATVTANTHVGQGTLPFRVLDTDAGDVTVADDLRLTFVAATNTLVNATLTGFAMFVCNEVEASAEVPSA